MRPLVYVAAGSQANFYSPATYLGRAEQGAGFGCDDASQPVRRLDTQVRLLPTVALSRDDDFAWLAFRGRWGELAGPEFDGPTGPNLKRQWQAPFSWEEGLRHSSVKAPSRELIGPNAARAFCNAVASGSDMLLPLILALPLLAGAAAVAAGLGMLVALTRTRYWPIASRPLRARRRIGQVLLAALFVYRSNWRLFLGIGLIFIPAVPTVALVHWLVLNLSPVEPIVPIPAGNIGQELVLHFALSELEFGPAYAAVLILSTLALARIDAGKPVSVRAVLLDLPRALATALLPRLVAVGVVAALAFTIIGIPLALRYAVRWTFIEQAVLLDGRRGSGAFRQSEAAAANDSWWTAASVLSLGALGLVAAPAFGILLLLFFTSVPLLAINVLTSVVYVALAPYVAIALALVYFDLGARTVHAPGVQKLGDTGEGAVSRTLTG
jgi:hypothetical protein